MSLKRLIKVYIGKHLLSKRTKTIIRRKGFYNFNTARSIAIFFDATNSEEYASARFLFNYLNERKIKTRCLGFLKPQDIEEAPSTFSGFSFFSENDFSLVGTPVGAIVQEFCNTEFDILIDINIEENYFLDALVAYSIAKMKIGLKRVDKGYYDFMIDIPTETVLVEQLVEEIKRYMNK